MRAVLRRKCGRIEGAIVLSKALHDPGLMGKQTRLFRNHIKLIFGAK